MEEIPPSYELATVRDAWAIIARYIPSADLCAASLVSRRWHEIFVPFLWGNPASHFGTDNDAVYVALTRFRRTLKRARLEVRMLTHTLHLPPALSEIYGGPRPEWLRDILDYLPCLQSLIVSGLPFFDHNATMALKSLLNQGTIQEYQPYNLRLLLAEREPNTTSIGIAHALSRFPLLIYLDLSYTSSARDRMVLSMLSELRELQVLKLRGIGLKDADAEFLANAIGTRVRFLDLRNNLLTDMAVRSLLQACFVPPGTLLSQGRGYTADILRRPDLDEKFLELLTHPLTGRSLLENLPHVGITHLYISDNKLTVEGVASLLASKRLHLLDAGTVDTAKSLRKGQHALSPDGQANGAGIFPGAEKLVPILGTSAKDNLTYLRVHHAVVTKDAPTKENNIPLNDLLPELPGDMERLQLENTQPYSELDPANEIFELPSESEPRFELADTSVSRSNAASAPPPAARDIRCIYEDEPLPVGRGPAFAPEVADSNHFPDDEAAMSNARRTGLLQSQPGRAETSAPSFVDDSKLSENVEENSLPASVSTPRAKKIQDLLAKRPKNKVLPLRHRDAAYPYLHPSHIPHVETLVLTDVPSHVPADSPIISSLIRFITACSDEVLLASLQARADYSLPPGRDRMRAEQQHAKSLFALERLVLEITPVVKKSEPTKLSSWKSQYYEHVASKSATGDYDSERLWSAAMDDFSFFGNEECGVPDDDMDKNFPMAFLNEKVLLMPEDNESTHSGLSELEAPLSPNLRQPSPHLPLHARRSRPSSIHLSPRAASPGLAQSSPSPWSTNHVSGNADQPAVPEAPEVDLVATLAAFRRTKKAEFEELVRMDLERRIAATQAASPSSSSLSSSSEQVRSSLQPPRGDFVPPSSPSIPLYVEGHWKGEVKVVRNAVLKGRSGVVDLFGNYFEKGFLYP
ncbi:hypothetical protein VTN77DRAFT_1268 [Rasamsonia byssochlamydoides]|uniref:uncharacterized protein n=1 Tax=Rasamsonia byssochlamydoides TaxID=89139 RepID=UPI0037430416